MPIEPCVKDLEGLVPVDVRSRGSRAGRRSGHAGATRLVAATLALAVLSGCASTPPVPPAPAGPDLASAIEAASKADTAIVAFDAPQPCCPKQTLPQFLGITGACDAILGVANNIRNRLGLLFPGLEAKPPVLAITDPANLAEGAPPAVKTAAEVKAQEDQAAQKIKALRYLATIGCGGCYENVEEAFLAALTDCTEEVRYEAVLAIRETTGKECCFCSHGACCSEKIQKKLRELAYDLKGPCCPTEPSARVRRQARLALQACGPATVVEEPEVEPEPEVAPEPELIEAPGDGGSADAADDETGEGDEDADEDSQSLPEPPSAGGSGGAAPRTASRDMPLTIPPPAPKRLPAVYQR
ncbi:MAG: hypothetical protein AAGJ46_03390 [Planctomycetota bacterium]